MSTSTCRGRGRRRNVGSPSLNVHIDKLIITSPVTIPETPERQLMSEPHPPSEPPQTQERRRRERRRGEPRWPMVLLIIATVLNPVLGPAYVDLRDGLRRSPIWTAVAGFLESYGSVDLYAAAQVRRLSELLVCPMPVRPVTVWIRSVPEFWICPVPVPPVLTVQLSVGCLLSSCGEPYELADGVDDGWNIRTSSGCQLLCPPSPH
jgi:hypothetical protein